ncbi:hypothetical protein ABIE26_000481 [Pedobacter africanus]|uniref:Uncharacterized protein n=1 Tax=Pedobacter africanus TaxID=151894 RepID=A0ACC6KVC7_9SPHI|nr:fasciclin domain-containing protein [Pedobacter africanus]MDR6783031.1 hypothetical protein [Pedobacter africanus]
MKKINIIKPAFYICICIAAFVACKKHDYYNDGGLARQSELEKSMTMYDFLTSKKQGNFDSLLKIIDLTGTKSVVNQNNITFFAPCNESVMGLQNQYRANPDDAKQLRRPLNKMNVDTLKMLLNRLIVPNSRITIDQAYIDGVKYYKDSNGDSLLIKGVRDDYNNGGVTAIGQGRIKIVYEHRRTLKDKENSILQMKTHDLITANGMIHVLQGGSSFHTGLIIKK